MEWKVIVFPVIRHSVLSIIFSCFSGSLICIKMVSWVQVVCINEVPQTPWKHGSWKQWKSYPKTVTEWENRTLLWLCVVEKDFWFCLSFQWFIGPYRCPSISKFIWAIFLLISSLQNCLHLRFWEWCKHNKLELLSQLLFAQLIVLLLSFSLLIYTCEITLPFSFFFLFSQLI